MIGVNMSNIEAAGNYPRPTAGGYVIKITSVVNNKQKERLDIEFDFAEGDLENYYKDMQERFKFWGGKFSKSYKANALPFFRGFIETVDRCNGFVDGLIINDFEDVDETKLAGLKVGMVVGEKEYIGNDGKKKVRLDTYNAKFTSIDDIRAGNYTIPDFIPLEETPNGSTEVVDTTGDFGPITNDECPF